MSDKLELLAYLLCTVNNFTSSNYLLRTVKKIVFQKTTVKLEVDLNMKYQHY